MKIDTATGCRENRRAEQVICIYEHRRKEDEVSFFPILPKKDISNNHRKNKMQEIMHKRPEIRIIHYISALWKDLFSNI